MYQPVTNVDELEQLIEKVKTAQEKFASYSQEQVNEIFRMAAIAANAERIKLAKEAVEDTGMGIIEDKVIKNHFASEYIFHQYKDAKTCGVVEEDRSFGIKKIAEPIGIIAGVIPTTNPTSTAIFKSLIALKTRNAIIFSPHPRAKRCTINAAKTILEAAVKAGAPENIIGWIDEPTVELSQCLMKHPGISMILATGGPGMVKAAYSSGKPAIGVGPGNTPVIIDETADIKMAVNSVLMSKTFDNGMICASEQSIIVHKDIYKEVRKELQERGAYILKEDEKEKVGSVVIVDGHVNAAIVGQAASKIAGLAGVNVPETTKVLIGEAEKIDTSEPFSYEKLSPVLGMYQCDSFEEGVEKAAKLVEFGGFGHTSVLYTNPTNKERINLFGDKVKTSRMLLNMPASQGAIGDIYNFKLAPSLTLGCGTWGGNSVSENVGVKHLINIKTIAARRENMLWFKVPSKIYFKFGCLPVALQDLASKKKAFLVTDQSLFDLGYTEKITEILEDMHIDYEIFHEVLPDPTLGTITKGVELINKFNPDVIIALGGGSPMDAAKIIWMLYEHPEVKFEGLALRFMDIRKRIYTFPTLGKKADLVCIPTTSGTGSEVTPFAVVTDEATGVKYPVADYELTPSMAIIDPELVLSMPKGLTSYSGIDVLTHAIEAYVSTLATDYTNSIALQAMDLVFKYLKRSYDNGSKDVEAKEKMHYASCLAGMAFANAFLGICHSMAHKLGSTFHVAHGLANGMLLTQSIIFNATDAPRKQAAFPQYKYPQAKRRYAEIADYLKVGGKTDEEKVQKLIDAIEKLKEEIHIPRSLKESGIPEEDFYAKLDLMSEMAFDDQCTSANPRYPLIAEIKQMYINAYHGELKEIVI